MLHHYESKSRGYEDTPEKRNRFEKGEAKAKNGVIWTAISKDNIILKKGTVCSVVSIEGNTICVEEKNEVN